MKSKDVGTTITTNDHHVRLRIFDGIIPPDAYHKEMLELEQGQHRQTRIELTEERKKIAKLEADLLKALYIATSLQNEGHDSE